MYCGKKVRNAALATKNLPPSMSDLIVIFTTTKCCVLMRENFSKLQQNMHGGRVCETLSRARWMFIFHRWYGRDRRYRQNWQVATMTLFVCFFTFRLVDNVVFRSLFLGKDNQRLQKRWRPVQLQCIRLLCALPNGQSG